MTNTKRPSISLERLQKEIEKINTPITSQTRAVDERFWKPEVDKSGNGMATIRFLPAPGDDALPWARFWDHGFVGPTGKWYIEKSLTSLDQKDPVAEFNKKLWFASTDPDSKERKQAVLQKRRLHYVCNILVVSDPKNPSNEGKVFLFKFGKKIFDKITQLTNPEFEGDASVNVFDLEKGANFKLRIRKVDGFPNYDLSTFDSPSPINSKDINIICSKLYPLDEFTDPTTYKSYDELKSRLDEVLGLNETVSEPRPSSRTVTPKKTLIEEEDTPPFDVDEEDDDLKQFKALARA